MLASLQVHNFALIEDARVDFTQGFNVFTGETGAGKSILIDAFGMVLGARANADFVRSGTDGFWVQGVFSDVDNPALDELFQEQGIDLEEEIFLKRMVNAQGKSKATINGVQVPLQVLRQVGSLLVNIHGQHENQSLLQPDIPRKLVDVYGGETLAACLVPYQGAYKELKEARKALAELMQANKDRQQLVELYERTIAEIDAAQLQPGEEEQLQEEFKVLQHGEKIIDSLNAAQEVLEGERGALNSLAAARREISYALSFDESLQGLYDSIDSAWVTLEDAYGELGGYLDKFDFNPERVEAVQNRLDLLYELEKKYGRTVEEVLAHREETVNKLAVLNGIEDRIAELEKQMAGASAKAEKLAEQLTKERLVAAADLGKKITRHIRDLAMPEGNFVIKVSPSSDLGSYGKDELEFYFSANKGEPLAELGKVASGGELSRVALALKTALLTEEDVGTMVFDEIDAGVGGVTAERMGEKIAILSQHNQVLCITHLPQIAAFARQHIYIEKKATGERTSTQLKILNKEERIEELVRMAAGSNKSAAASKVAKELLEHASKKIS